MPSATGNINDDLEEFVGAIRANEEKVLKQFYQQNYPMVEKFVLDNSGTIDEARDIYQEAFIAVWRNIQLGRFQLRADSSPQAYLFKVAKYKWLDHLRATKRKTWCLCRAMKKLKNCRRRNTVASKLSNLHLVN